MDNWHTLSYKGKYAGEVMLELTYYDSRPDAREHQRKHSVGEKKIKRRPLPSDMHTTPMPHQMENTRTAGPRAMGSRARAPSSQSSVSAPPVQYPYNYPPQDDHDYHPGFQPQPIALPDLPELPPSRAQRGSLPPQPRMVSQPASYHGRTQSHPNLPHSHSAPTTVPQAQDPYAYPQARTPRTRAYEEPSLQPTVEDEMEDLPPLPPSHVNRPSPRGPPPRSHSVDDYTAAPPPAAYGSPNFRSSYSGSPAHAGYPPSSAASSPGYPRPSSSNRLPARHSVTEPYNTVTPPRTHPLAQEMYRAASPASYGAYQVNDADQQGFVPDGAPIIKPRAISPAPSPQPRNSLASIRHPVQTFALQSSSAAASTPDLRTSGLPNRSLPTRKSVSPRPSVGRPSTGGVPFSPDDYGSFNPSASQSSAYLNSQNPNPNSPYHIPNAPRAGSEEPQGERPLPNPDGPITTWDGRTVDPSDHLPVHSWAPEPEKKTSTPEKRYGAGGYDPNRPRGMSGPRQNVHNVPSNGGRVGRDIVVNVRSKHSPNPNAYDAPSPNGSAGRNRLVKRASAPRGMNPYDNSNYPLNEIAVPNPYATSQYSADGRPASADSRYQSRSPAPQQQQQKQHQQPQQRHYGDIFGGNYEGGSQYGGSQYASSQYSGDGYAGGGGGYQRGYSEPAPDLPPKVAYDDHAYGTSALEKEMQRIDIGGSKRGGPGMGTVVARRNRYQ